MNGAQRVIDSWNGRAGRKRSGGGVGDPVPNLVIRRRAITLRCLLLAGIVVDGLCMLAFGSNLHALWSVLLVASGIYIGLLTIDGNSRVAVVLCLSGLAAVPIALFARALPIHTFDCTYLDRVDKIVIDSAPSGGEIVLTDSRSIAEFREFLSSGFADLKGVN
jgi:hypothetical protein